MTEDEKRKFEIMLHGAKRAGWARRQEQDRIGDMIEQMLYEAKSVETCDILVRLGRHIFDGGKP